MINFKAIARSIGYAFSGLSYVIRTQNNARFHTLATIIVLALSFFLQLNLIQWCLILIAIFLVWIAECFNTAIEKIFDLIEPDHHPLVKFGKDSGAAAVLLAAFLSVIIGLIVLGPPLYQKLQALFG